MNNPLRIGNFDLYWLNGGEFMLDGGNMFGVVPRVLWEKKFSSDEHGYVKLVNTPILVKTPHGNIVIETGLGNKLTDKQKKIFRFSGSWSVQEDLNTLGMSVDDIDHVILTHCDFDHSGGILMYNSQGKKQLTFPRARHWINRMEWEDVQNPHIRAANTYWPINFDLLQESPLLATVEKEKEILPGVKIIHTGGHTRGHQIIWLESQHQHAVHLGDLFPNQAYTNPLWVTPYDNFPLESIDQKQLLFAKAVSLGSWFTFYHDPYMFACKLNKEGEIMEQWGGVEPMPGME